MLVIGDSALFHGRYEQIVGTAVVVAAAASDGAAPVSAVTSDRIVFKAATPDCLQRVLQLLGLARAEVVCGGGGGDEHRAHAATGAAGEAGEMGATPDEGVRDTTRGTGRKKRQRAGDRTESPLGVDDGE